MFLIDKTEKNIFDWSKYMKVGWLHQVEYSKCGNIDDYVNVEMAVDFHVGVGENKTKF